MVTAPYDYPHPGSADHLPHGDELEALEQENQAIAARVEEILQTCAAGQGTADDEAEWRDILGRSLQIHRRIEEIHGARHRAYLEPQLRCGSRLAGEPGEG